MAATVAVVGTFDTKREELEFLADAVTAAGATALRIDCSLRGGQSAMVDVAVSEVARAAGLQLADLGRLSRGEAVAAMTDGLAELVVHYAARGDIQAVVGAGGGTAASLFGQVARRLPFGFPKLLVSTVAAGDPLRFLGATDTLVLHPVADLEGLNALTRSALGRAGRAIASLALAYTGEAPEAEAAGSVAATMFGITTECVSRARRTLNARGREVVVFHATGVGGQSYERFIDAGLASAALDVTTTELADEVVGGVLSAGPERLRAAGRQGIPQVVCPGAVDAVNFRGPESVPERLRGRAMVRHNPQVTLVRTNPEECAAIGALIAERLTGARGPVTIALPLRGLSALDRKGEPFAYPEANAALFDAIRGGVPSSVEVLEVDAHINDPSFSDLVAATIDRSLGPEPFERTIAGSSPL